MPFNGVFPFLSLFPAQRFGTLKRLVFITKERKKKEDLMTGFWNRWGLSAMLLVRKNRNYNFALETLFGKKNNFNIMQVDLKVKHNTKKGRRCIVT